MYITNNKLFFILLFSMAYASFCQAEKIYQWTDEHGQVHFGDKASSSNAKSIEIRPASVGDPSAASRS